MKIKKNDNVLVIAGKDKGKTAVVERVFPNENRIVAKGIAIAKKHVKPSKKTPQGGIIEINQKINASNVMILCPACGKPSKIGFSITEKGKLRICRKCKQNIESGENK